MKGTLRIGLLSIASVVLIGAVLYGCENSSSTRRSAGEAKDGQLARHATAPSYDYNSAGVGGKRADEVWIIEKAEEEVARDASRQMDGLQELVAPDSPPASPSTAATTPTRQGMLPQSTTRGGREQMLETSMERNKTAATPAPTTSARNNRRLQPHEEAMDDRLIFERRAKIQRAQRPAPTLGDIPIIGEAFADHDDREATAGLVYPAFDDVRCGALCVVVPNQPRVVPVPLEHTEVKASIAGYIGSVNVKQQYHNPFDVKIEATYVFPLPDDAAVNDFVMTIGDRTIRGIIREREEARKLYEQARAQGHTASLLQQERPNIFMQKVANIEPGKRIDIDITYYHTLAYDDGWYEWIFPMTVGPRYNPPGSTDGVGAAPRSGPGQTAQATEVQYLAPNERSGHDIALEVDIEAGVVIEDLICRSHAIERREYSQSRTIVSLSPSDSIPNKDFVLRYRVAGDRVKTGFVTHRTDHGSYFTFMMYPPSSLQDLERGPVELVFVLDCSGSMRGRPIEQAKLAIERGLSHLRPEDSFQIIRFSNNASQLGPRPLAATPENIERGKAYLRSLNGSGGTQMVEGIKAALDFPHDDNRLRFVVFATDGFIGNEKQILGAMSTHLRESRIFSFGVGSAPNRYLMDRMASLGRGVAAYLSLNDSPVDAMDRFFERVSHPALSDISIDWNAFGATQVYPAKAPDLFVGRPVIFTGKLDSSHKNELHLTGRVGGKERDMRYTIGGGNASDEQPALAAIWARNAIKDMTKRALCTNPSTISKAPCARLRWNTAWCRHIHRSLPSIRSCAQAVTMASAWSCRSMCLSACAMTPPSVRPVDDMGVVKNHDLIEQCHSGDGRNARASSTSISSRSCN